MSVLDFLWRRFHKEIAATREEIGQLTELTAAFKREVERRLDKLATREELDAAKAQLMQGIGDATTRVTTDIQALRDQIKNGQPITDQDLADLQADITAVGQIDPANPQPPPARRR